MFDTIMITGGSGLVGRNLLDNQDLHKYHILAPTHAELDLGDYPAVLDYISFCHPDLIVHAAGKVGGIMANLQDMYGFYMQNIFMGLNLVKAARESGVRYFLNLSSSCAYPCEAPNPLREEYILSGRFEPTNEGYAMAKLAVLKACQFTSDQHSAFQYKTLIPCNLYGIYDKFDPVSSHFMAAILMKLHDAKFQHQDRVEIWGDGTARRELMFTTDFAEIVAKCIDNFACLPLIMNVGTGVDYSINEYYATAARVMGVDVEFTHDLSKPGGMRQKLLDVSIQKQLGFNAISSLEEGIHQTYKYLLRVKGGGHSYAV